MASGRGETMSMWIERMASDQSAGRIHGAGSSGRIPFLKLNFRLAAVEGPVQTKLAVGARHAGPH